MNDPLPKDDRKNAAHEAFEGLLAILKRLRAPDGCPWDRKQTLKTMAPLILEEAYEVIEAIEDDDPGRTCEELGDLSMNVLLSSLIAEEKGDFDVAEVYRKIARKLINRHPHVFSDMGPLDEKRFLRIWDEIKREERREKQEDTSSVAGIPRSMPSLFRLIKLLGKMRRVRPDLPLLRTEKEGVVRGLEELLAGGVFSDRQVGEFLLTFVAFLARDDVNPELALQRACRDLEASFRSLESAFPEGLGQADAAVVAEAWRRIRGEDRG